MNTKSKLITVAGATTLLLAIAAAHSSVIPRSKAPEYKYSFKMGNHETVTLWGAKPTPKIKKSNLIDNEMYSLWPKRILENLKARINKDPVKEERDRREFSTIMASLTEHDKKNVCKDVDVGNFYEIFTICHGDTHFQSCTEFLERYAPGKFIPCARKIIRDMERRLENFEQIEITLDSLNRFFRVGLEIAGHLTDEKMYKYLKEVDLVKVQFDIIFLIKLCRGSLRLREIGKKAWVAGSLSDVIGALDYRLYPIRLIPFSKVNIVNVARGIGASGEIELTPRFSLINEYARLAAQMENSKAFAAIKINLQRQISETFDQLYIEA